MMHLVVFLGFAACHSTGINAQTKSCDSWLSCMPWYMYSRYIQMISPNTLLCDQASLNWVSHSHSLTQCPVRQLWQDTLHQSGKSQNQRVVSRVHTLIYLTESNAALPKHSDLDMFKHPHGIASYQPVYPQRHCRTALCAV